jgi:hypothetical protein
MSDWDGRIPLGPMPKSDKAVLLEDGRIPFGGPEQTAEELVRAADKVAGNPFGIVAQVDGRDLNPRRVSFGPGWEPESFIVIDGEEGTKPLSDHEPEDEKSAIIAAARAVDAAEREAQELRYITPGLNPFIKLS